MRLTSLCAAAVITAAGLLPGAAASAAPASHVPAIFSCPTGATTNPYAMGTLAPIRARWADFNNDSLGEGIRADSAPRDMNWHGITCDPHGNPVGFWETDGGLFLAAQDSCGHWILKGSRADIGTTTVDVVHHTAHGWYLNFASAHCNGGTGGSYPDLWASTGHAGDLWVNTRFVPVTRHLYLKMTVKPR